MQQLNREAVCVSVQTADWALLVSAVRDASDRRIVPMIWVNDRAPLFVECARASIWRQAGQVHVLRNSDLLPAQRKAQLADAIASTFEELRSLYRVLAYVQNPSSAAEANYSAKNRFDRPVPISIGSEPAYDWLLRKSEEASRAHRVLLYLANGDSGSIPAITRPTSEERADREENFLLRGNQPEWRNV